MVRGLGNRRRPSQPLSSAAPPITSPDYSQELADLAARILYRSPLPSHNDLPIYILNAAALPDAKQTNYDVLLPYVLERLPGEEELIGGLKYEVIFFAGAGEQGAVKAKKGLPGWGWLSQAYSLLTRVLRKRLHKLYIVHEKTWIRMLIETFSTIVTSKGRRKIVHISTLYQLALILPIQDLQIPPSAFASDRRFCPVIDVPYMVGKRAFGVDEPLPKASNGKLRLPRVLRETSAFVTLEPMLKVEGIFRINARAVMVDVAKEAYTRGQKFIAWKEGDSMLASVHRREGHGDVSVEDLARTDGYDLHTATALIKQWYKDLHDPIFQQTSYNALRRVISGRESDIPTSTVIGMLADSNDWSPLSNAAKQILLMHLLPLLSAVIEFQDSNHMDPFNLAVCFAPTMLRGPDPKEDMEMVGLIQNILTHMIRLWKSDLAPTFSLNEEHFRDALRLPAASEDREDPLERPRRDTATDVDQNQGSIALIQGKAESEDEQEPPPLPPRPSTMSFDNDSMDAMSKVRRKPAPPMASLPRYSVVMRENPTTLQHLPNYNTVEDPDDDFEPANPSDLPPYQSISPLSAQDSPLSPPTRPAPSKPSSDPEIEPSAP